MAWRATLLCKEANEVRQAIQFAFNQSQIDFNNLKKKNQGGQIEIREEKTVGYLLNEVTFVMESEKNFIFLEYANAFFSRMVIKYLNSCQFNRFLVRNNQPRTLKFGINTDFTGTYLYI